jgi:hypothetical protein
MHVPMFGSFREKLQKNLEQDTGQYVKRYGLGVVSFVHFGQQFQEGERQQKCPTKGEQEVYVLDILGPCYVRKGKTGPNGQYGNNVNDVDGKIHK